jgi:hypothetical protein
MDDSVHILISWWTQFWNWRGEIREEVVEREVLPDGRRGEAVMRVRIKRERTWKRKLNCILVTQD